MVNLRFNFKMDLADISTIDFAFANSYAELETDPFLEKSFPEEGTYSQRSIILTLSAEEAELLPEQFYALATVNFKNGETIKAHAFKNTAKEEALSAALALEDTEFNINFFIDEVAGGGGNGTNISVEAGGHLDLSNGVLSTEANKVYAPAFDSNGNISYNVEDYPNVQNGDLIIDGHHASGHPRIWYQVDGVHDTVVTWAELEYDKNTYTSNEAPPTTDNYNSVYHMGDIWIDTTNDIKYLLIQKRNTQEQYALNWFNLSERTAYAAGNGIDINGSNISIDLKTGETVLGFDNGQLKSNLSNYYTKTEIDQMISADLKIEIVANLPTQDIDTHTIYFVPKSTAETNNTYDEYMYISNTWELIGTTEVDLTGYYTSNQTDNLLDSKVDIIETTGNVAVTRADYSTSIDVSNYATFLCIAADNTNYADTIVYRYDENGDLISYSAINKGGAEWQTFVKVDVSQATTIKLKKETALGTTTLTYKLSNDVVRKKEYNNNVYTKAQLDPQLSIKPNIYWGRTALTTRKRAIDTRTWDPPGDDYTNVKIGDVYKHMSDGSNIDDVYIVTNVWNSQTNSARYFIGTKVIDNIIDDTHKVSADYIEDGSNYMVIPKPTIADAGKVLQVDSNGQPAWVNA